MNPKALVLLIATGACGSVEAPDVPLYYIDPGPYARPDITQVWTIAAEELGLPFVDDATQFGFQIYARALTADGQCADGAVIGTYDPGSHDLNFLACDTCLGKTALPHELLHLASDVYGWPPDHSRPGLWGVDSVESRIYARVLAESATCAVTP